MNPIEQLLFHAPEIESQLGYRFRDHSLMALAFVHRSFINEHREIDQHNERLEFLGDSVLGLLVAEHLYRHMPSTPEGDLSYLRSRLVEASSCIAYMQKLDLEKYLLLGKGEKRNDGRGRDSILADLFEALIGAIFLDGGLPAAQQFLFGNFSEDIASILKMPLNNWKALLQDYCQKNFQQTPTYIILHEAGPDHSKTFTIAVSVNGKEIAQGSGASKKEAQQAAAESAVRNFNLSPSPFSEYKSHGS